MSGKTVETMIAESLAYGAKAFGAYDSERASALLGVCDDDDENDARHVFWGSDSDGREWCVVLS